MTAHDRRTKRTQAALMRALLDLSTAQPYTDISIRDITERANVGYATFFRHYHTKEALLLDVLSESLTELIRLIEPPALQGQLSRAGQRLFAYVADHRTLVQVLLAAQGSPEVQASMWATARQPRQP